MNLQDAFHSPDSHVLGAVMFIDMNNSTAMKEKETEAAWLNTLAALYDIIVEHTKDGDGSKIVKFLGDGAMAFYGEEQVTEAINAAIGIQEALDRGRKDRKMECSCTIGIATGRMVRVPTPQGTNDYFGAVVDRASRLCGAGSPNSILVDDETMNNARLLRVHSVIGQALDRTSSDYRGDSQKIILPGISKEVKYYEIHWARERFGVKSKTTSDAVDRLIEGAGRTSPFTSAGSGTASAGWKRGIVRHWDSDKNYGFITAENGDHYSNRALTVGDHPLSEGTEVFFAAAPPLRPGAAPAASCVIAIGETIHGVIANMNQEKHFGFVRVRDRHKDTQDIFMYAGDNARNFTTGDHISFVVGKNQKGAVALSPNVIEHAYAENETEGAPAQSVGDSPAPAS